MLVGEVQLAAVEAVDVTGIHAMNICGVFHTIAAPNQKEEVENHSYRRAHCHAVHPLPNQRLTSGLSRKNKSEMEKLRVLYVSTLILEGQANQSL